MFEADAIADEPQCETCGKKIDPKLGRVLGDADDNVARCARCSESTTGNDYATDARAAHIAVVTRSGRRIQ